MSEMAYIGDTVRLTVEFRTFDGIYADPTDIQLKIYDYNSRQQIGETISVTNAHRTDIGRYKVPYTIPEIPISPNSYIVFGFSGTLEGLKVEKKKRLQIVWAES